MSADSTLIVHHCFTLVIFSLILGGLYKENQIQSPMQTSCDAKKKIISEGVYLYLWDTVVWKCFLQMFCVHISKV